MRRIGRASLLPASLAVSTMLVSLIQLALPGAAFVPMRIGASRAMLQQTVKPAGVPRSAPWAISGRLLTGKTTTRAKQEPSSEASPPTAAQLRAKEKEIQEDRLKKVKSMQEAGHPAFASTYGVTYTASAIEKR